jgi:5-methylcytosine-specific restriction endonuclease McrA
MTRVCIRYGRGCSDGGRCPPGKSRCRAHGGGSWARVNPAAKERYGAQWQETRARILRGSPRCEVCGAPATDVDHIVAVADSGGMYDRANLRSLCAECHKRHTAEQNRARRKRRRQQGRT